MGQTRNRKNNKTPVTPRPPQVTQKVKFSEDTNVPNQTNQEKRIYKLQEEDDWQPTFGAVVKMLLSIRIASALWAVVNDCDEVYNYWEPLHMMIYGNGFQTWEYSPEYGIRSYFYLYCYYLPGRLFAYLFPDAKIAVFTLIRLYIGVFCLLGEYYAYSAICKKINVATGRFFIMFTMCSSGMFGASTAFLPSSFAMAVGFYGLGANLNRQWSLAVFCVAFSTLVGWPFVAALGLPVIVEMLFARRIFALFIKWSILFGGLILVLVIYVDTHYFGKLTFAPLKIVMYNVLSGPGPALYGVEPWYYYLKNLFLNWNIAFLISVIAVPLKFFVYKQTIETTENTRKIWRLPFDFAWSSKFEPVFMYTYAMAVWFAIFFTTPHKEERFMFPVYPHIALLAAIGCDALHRLMRKTWCEDLKIVYGIIVMFVIVSGSRGFAMYHNYGAHMEIYKSLNDELHVHHDFNRFNDPIRVCVGKEWHRFPSNFFIPRVARSDLSEERAVEMQFIRSEFRGILPKHFHKGETMEMTTRHIPSDMNDQNKEEVSRYVPMDSCDYVINVDKTASEREPDLRSKKMEWEPIAELPFIDAENSKTITRAFYLPWLSEKFNVYSNYTLYRKMKSRS